MGLSPSPSSLPTAPGSPQLPLGSTRSWPGSPHSRMPSLGAAHCAPGEAGPPWRGNDPPGDGQREWRRQGPRSMWVPRVPGRVGAPSSGFLELQQQLYCVPGGALRACWRPEEASLQGLSLSVERPRFRQRGQNRGFLGRRVRMFSGARAKQEPGNVTLLNVGRSHIFSLEKPKSRERDLDVSRWVAPRPGAKWAALLERDVVPRPSTGLCSPGLVLTGVSS